MALIRVAQYNSTPTVVTDYQAQNAHLQAFTNQLMTQQFILDSGTAKPVIKQGCYVSHGGSLYIADADTSITGSPSDGSVYIRVSGTTSLTVEFVTSISGYTWNPAYSALTSTTYTLLPYLIVKASTVWARYNFNPNNQQFGSLASLAVIGNATVGGTLGVTGAISGASLGVTGNTTIGGTLGVTGAISGATVNTGQGATEVYLMNQNLRKTDNVSFGNINPPVDNNDATMPSVGIGGFSYAHHSTKVASQYPSITIGSGGTWVYIANSYMVGYSSSYVTRVGRVAGGSSVEGSVSATADGTESGVVDVIAWRIA